MREAPWRPGAYHKIIIHTHLFWPGRSEMRMQDVSVEDNVKIVCIAYHLILHERCEARRGHGEARRARSEGHARWPTFRFLLALCHTLVGTDHEQKQSRGARGVDGDQCYVLGDGRGVPKFVRLAPRPC